MTRALALVLLLRGVALAAILQEVLPGIAAVAQSQTPVANVLYCAAVPAYKTFTGTKFAGDVYTADAGSTTGFGIYPDANGGTALATVSGSSAAIAVITGTGFSIPLVVGTYYRICACTTSTLVRYTSARTLVAGGTFASQNDLMNAATPMIGTAANACTAGVPPSTTGAITANNNVAIPIVLIE